MDYRGPPPSLRYRGQPRSRSLSPRRRASPGRPSSMSGLSSTPPSNRYSREVDDRYYRRDYYYRNERLPSPPLMHPPPPSSFSPPTSRGSYRDEGDYYYSAQAQRPPPPPPLPSDRYYDRYYSRDRYNDRRYRPSPYYPQSQPSRPPPPRSRRPIDRGSEQDRRDSTTIFIGNLPYEFRERHVHDMFERYGPVVKATVPMDAMTGKNKGFAFAEFEKRRDAEDAFDKMHGFSVEGRRLKLDWDIGLSKKDEHRNVSRRPDDRRSPSDSHGRQLSPPPPPPMPRYSRTSRDMYRR